MERRYIDRALAQRRWWDWVHSRGQLDPGDYFELSLDELREVTRFALASAEEVLAAYEAAVPDDNRPRAALASIHR